MRSTQLLSAAAAIGATFVSAESCNKDITITENTPSISCTTINADVIVDPSLAGSLDLEGPQKITGNLIINNATQLLGFTSSTLKEIDGKFELQGLNLLSNLQLENLESVGEIYFEKLTQLDTMTFGTSGVSKANNITITDTRLGSLDGLNIATVGTFEVSNNPQLLELNSDLVNATDALIFQTNGPSMTITMNKLEFANVAEFSQIKTLTVPSLKSVGRLSFVVNPMMNSFSASNLTSVADSLTFANNTALTNFSFPALTKIAGDLTVTNNTKLADLTGLPKLQSVFGGITVGGVFEKVNLPKLNQVTGTVSADTTTSEKSFCEYFNNLASNKDISGGESCHYNNKNALTGGSGGQTTSSSGGDGSSDDDGDSAAGLTTVNFGVLAAAAIFAATQLF